MYARDPKPILSVSHSRYRKFWKSTPDPFLMPTHAWYTTPQEIDKNPKVQMTCCINLLSCIGNYFKFHVKVSKNISSIACNAPNMAYRWFTINILSMAFRSKLCTCFWTFCQCTHARQVGRGADKGDGLRLRVVVGLAASRRDVRGVGEKRGDGSRLAGRRQTSAVVESADRWASIVGRAGAGRVARRQLRVRFGRDTELPAATLNTAHTFP